MGRLSFTAKIVLAMILSIVVGLALQLCGRADVATRFIALGGTAFLNLIKFIVCPLVFFSVMAGVVSMDDVKKVGVLGFKTLALFSITTAVAIASALAICLMVRGVFPILSQPVAAEKIVVPKSLSLSDMILGVFPSNFAMPFVEANMLQVIVMALVFAIAIVLIGGVARRRLIAGVRLMNSLFVTTLDMIMRLSPLGVFCLMCPVVASNGVAVLGSLVKVIAVMYVCYAVHLVVFDSILVSVVSGVHPARFLREMAPAAIFAFSSSSSVGTLPINLNCVRRIGVSDDVASFVLPLGATINMNGTVIYHGVCAVFISSCYGLSLTMDQIVTIIATSTLASIGTAGVPGAGIAMLAMVLSAAGLPLDGIALVAGIDRLFDMGRTVVNITGDAATAVVLGVQRRKVARACR